MRRVAGRVLVALGRAFMVLGLRGADREFLMGDLEEELTSRSTRTGAPAAVGLWYLGQSLRAVVGRAGSRLRHRGPFRRRPDRDRGGDGFVMTTVQDLRFSARVLRKQPAFALGAMFTLALGIGAVATMFTFVNGLLLRPLGYPEADRLVMLEGVSSRGATYDRVDYLNYRDWAARSDGLEVSAAHYDASFNVATDGEPVRVSGLVATGALFSVLRAKAMLGRTFGSTDDAPGQPRVVVISHGLWQRCFGGVAEIVGRDIRLHGRAYRVIGVMPPSFAYPEYQDLWIPARIDAAEMIRGSNYWQVVARLRDGVTLAQERQELDVIGQQLAAEYPQVNAGNSVTATGFRDHWLWNSEVPLLLFLGVVVFVQMIATVNVGNLMLARASTRRKEVAIRSALGAGRGRLVRQLLTESLLLAGIGALLGLPLGAGGRDAILGSIPVELPRWFDFSIDLRVTVFIVAIAAVTGMVFGLVPAIYASRDLSEPLMHGGEGSARSPRQRLRGGLVVAEVALALVLLVGAALMLKGLSRVRSVDPGLDANGVLAVRLSLPAAQYEQPAQRRAFAARLMQEARALPGVSAAATAAWLPFSQNGSNRWLSPEGLELAAQEHPPSAGFNVIGGDYFETMGIPLLRGHAFARSASTLSDRPRQAIASQALVERLWPGEDGLGKRFRFGRPEETGNPLLTIVGVVGDIRYWGLDRPPQPRVYVPNEVNPSYTMSLVLRAAGDPAGLASVLRDLVRDLDPDLAPYEVKTMRRMPAESLWEPVVYSRMFVVFAALAMGLAAVGLYGVIAFSVGRRTQEIGIRLALGAAGGDVLRLIVRQAMSLVAVGIGLGLAGALLVSGVLSSLLYGVSARDPVVYATVALILVLVALVASLLPGRRATRVEPAIALRSD